MIVELNKGQIKASGNNSDFSIFVHNSFYCCAVFIDNGNWHGIANISVNCIYNDQSVYIVKKKMFTANQQLNKYDIHLV